MALPQNQALEVAYDEAEAAAQLTRLNLLAAIKRDRLRVVTRVNQRKSVIGFESLLIEIQDHQAAADYYGEPGSNRRVADQRQRQQP